MSHPEQSEKRGHLMQWYRGFLYTGQGIVALGFLLAFISLATGTIGNASRPGVGASLAGAGLLLMVTQYFLALRLRNRSIELVLEAQTSRHRSDELFAMTDMLQSAENHADAGAVLQTTSQRLLPTFSGALYVFTNSHDRLDLALSWSPGGDFEPAETLVPDNCWALKRGKPHINDIGPGILHCMHHSGGLAAMELPMVGRGMVHGLLMLATPEGAEALKRVTRIGRALADSMSLALSNIALQEKLRAQSLRDPLTGLYNRRYMEDALERYLTMAARNGDSTSVIMVDLDHFKRLNDEHGHAKGDAVLRDVATVLVGALRPADVVSRYGGEELLVILPGCPLQNAVLKAETLRARIEGLSGSHGVPISASFGVASVPQTSSSRDDLIPMADAALYAAKQAGRNCVHQAELRARRNDRGSKSDAPRLAVG